MKSENSIKDRLVLAKKTQVWLIGKLRERGIDVPPPQMSQIVNGVYVGPKSKAVLKTCDEILADWREA